MTEMSSRDVTAGDEKKLTLRDPMKTSSSVSNGMIITTTTTPPSKDTSTTSTTTSSPPPNTPPPTSSTVPFFAMYRFATLSDKVLMSIACLFGASTGVAMPLFSIFFGSLLNAFNQPNRQEAINEVCIQLAGLALAMGVAAYAGVTLASVSAVRQVARMRLAYMEALLRQDPGWYDVNASGEAASRMAADSVTITGGIGEKVVSSLTATTTFFAGFVIGFIKGWKMSLVVLGFLPVIAIVGGLLNKYIASGEKGNSVAYGKAGAVANEALSSIKTVAAYGGEEAEVKRYDTHLAASEAAGISKGWMTGAAIGVLLLTILSTYAVGLYFGGRLVVWSREADAVCATIYATMYSNCFTGGNVIQVIFALLIGASSLSQAAPALAAIAASRGAAFTMFAVIDRVPTIDVFSEKGLKPSAPLRGRIEFENVTFAYPSRPTQVILKDFNLVIEGGKTCALVGASGSGKSTIVALVQRWYDPLSGRITVDGIDIKEYNVAWLRGQQALVSQEPQLLATTLRENIALGKHGLVAASDEEVEEAAKAANAHPFITALTDGYETRVTSGSLSGGQKQRIAIARAIIRRAPLLLLDEATSALDTASERAIQRDIDRLLHNQKNNQTAIVIAHRLSTVTRADTIVVLEAGIVVEKGSHADLMAIEGGRYRRLRELQRAGAGEEALLDEERAEAMLEEKEAGEAAAAVVAATEQTSMTKDNNSVVVAVTTANAGGAATTSKPSSSASTPTSSATPTPEPEHPPVPFNRFWQYTKPEAAYIVAAIICSSIQGVTFPAFSMLLSRFLDVYYEQDNEVLLAKSAQYLGYLILIGVGVMLSSMGAAYCWHLTGERLLRRLRRDAFRGLLRSEIAWHDMPENSVGRVTSRLASEAELFKSSLGMNIGMHVQNFAGLISGLTIAFVASWRMTLVIIGVAPIIAAGGAAQAAFFLQADKKAQAAFAVCGDIATEAVTVSRAVTAFGLQSHIRSKFSHSLLVPTAASTRGALSAGIGLGVGNLVMIGTYALSFYIGSIFIDHGWMTFVELMQAFFAVVFAAVGLGNASAMGTDVAKSESAKRALFAMIDHVSTIDPMDTEKGLKPGKGNVPTVAGKIEFRDVTFEYPSRPGQQVLNGLNLTIQPGQTAAIVGPSGSGKSTVIMLLERFYNPKSGQVLLDGHPLEAYNVKALRATSAWVQQEAPLFAESIAYNIAYGTADPNDKPVAGLGVPPTMTSTGSNSETKNTKSATNKKLGKEVEEEEGEKPAGAAFGFSVSQAVYAAAEAASARGFVEKFVHGFATYAGDRGNQLSGGQRQRIAISRAVIRNPQLLFLDEATSALDSESEAVVQAAIEKLLMESKESAAKANTSTAQAQHQHHRTTIIIAHRLSTIKNADVVFVVDHGVVVEAGSHDELASRPGGLFARMLAQQDSGLGVVTSGGGRRRSSVSPNSAGAAAAAAAHASSIVA